MSRGTDIYQSSEIADLYVTYRPRYNADVFDTIVGFCQETPSAAFSLALDVGCGSGQSTVPLARHFRQVMGLDVSPAQISRAPTDLPNLSFRVGHAEDLSFVASSSVDLVTVATALHWLDTQRFYAEVERVLRPGGALVAYGCMLPLLDEPTAQDIVDRFDDSVAARTSIIRSAFQYVRKPFQAISLPFAGWRKCDSLKMERTWTVDEFMGYQCSYTPHHKKLLDPTDMASQNIRERLQAIYEDGRGGQRTIHVTFPVYMAMGHKPGGKGDKDASLLTAESVS